MFLSPHDAFPPTSGSERRIFEVSRGVAEFCCTHFVHPLEKACGSESSGYPGEIHPVKIGCRLGKIASPKILTRMLKIHREVGFDCIFVHTFLPCLQGLLIKLITGKPLLLDEQNAEFVRYRRTRSPVWPLVKVIETMACRKADLVYSVSEVDRGMIIDLGISPEKIIISRNGYDQGTFRPDPDAGGKAREELGIPPGQVVLYFGNYNYAPNSEALALIEGEIAPGVGAKLPGAVFVIAGRNPPQLGWKEPNIFFTGEVPRINDLINLSDLVICPLLSGGGTRLKILESIACGKRVISTTIGAEGLSGDIPGSHLFIEDELEPFVRRVVELLGKPGPSRAPGGLDARYSWRSIVRDSILPAIRRASAGQL